MKTELKTHPRLFTADPLKDHEIRDFGKIWLSPDEQISFVTASGKEYDVCAKEWGFYATPSINNRLKAQGFKTALVRNRQGRFYVMLVEQDRLEGFQKFLCEEKETLLEWLDDRNVGDRSQERESL